MSPSSINLAKRCWLQMSCALHPYHGHRNMLTVEDGLILQCGALIISYQKGRRSSKQYMKDKWKSASAKTELDIVYTGPVLTQTSNVLNVLLNHAQHANATAHRNHDSCSSQHQSWNTHGNSLVLTTSTLMDLNT